eukprot:1145785-Pelagomonas_calceolata.AAC.2
MEGNTEWAFAGVSSAVWDVAGEGELASNQAPAFRKHEFLFLEKPPLRGDALRALAQGANTVVCQLHTFAHTRPLWPAHSTSGSEIWN